MTSLHTGVPACSLQRLRPVVGRSRSYLIYLLGSPEVTLIFGAKLPVGFGRVGDVLHEERPRARFEHRPLRNSWSVRIAGGREVRPRPHYLVRQGNLRPLQFAGLAGGLVQIHPQIPTVPVWEHELNVDRMARQGLEIARG
jgi:hypothetical protein